MILSLPIGESIRLHGTFGIVIDNVQIQTSPWLSLIEIVESGIIPSVKNSLFRLYSSDFSISIFHRHGDDIRFWGNATSIDGRIGHYGSLRHTYISVQSEYNISNLPVYAVKSNYPLNVNGEFRDELSEIFVSGLVSEVDIAGESLHFNLWHFFRSNINALLLGFIAAIIACIIPKYLQKKNTGAAQ